MLQPPPQHIHNSNVGLIIYKDNVHVYYKYFYGSSLFIYIKNKRLCVCLFVSVHNILTSFKGTVNLHFKFQERYKYAHTNEKKCQNVNTHIK